MSILGILPGSHSTAMHRGMDALKINSVSGAESYHSNRIALSVCTPSTMSRKHDIVLLFDGNLHNSQDLVKNLGIEITSSAEILIYSYLHWGINFPKQLLGDFSFALWDCSKERLLLGRDVAGQRPLCHWNNGAEFRFASEPCGLLASSDITMQPDEVMLAEWLAQLRGYSNRTFFKNISSLASGHILQLEDGKLSLHKFWNPENISLLRLSDPREYADGLREILQQSVKDRVEGYGNSVGSHLSGGLDSSSVTVTAATLLAEQGKMLTAFTAVPTVTVDEKEFPNKFCNEGPYASSIAALYPNICHITVPNCQYALFPLLDWASTAAAQPVFNPANISWMHHIEQQVHDRGLRILLTGAMGNMTSSWKGRRAVGSLVCDGHILRALALAQQFHKKGQSWRSLLYDNIRPLLPDIIQYKIAVLRGKNLYPSGRATGLRPGFTEKMGFNEQKIHSRIQAMSGRRARTLQALRIDQGIYVASAKRMSGIDIADPTSDKRLMEFCLSVPEEFFCYQGQSRSLIRMAMAGRLPDHVLNEQRQGLQAADFVTHLAVSKVEISAELGRMRQSELLSSAIDIPALQKQVEHWPTGNTTKEDFIAYGMRLSRAISAGRFVRRIEEGTALKAEPVEPLFR